MGIQYNRGIWKIQNAKPDYYRMPNQKKRAKKGRNMEDETTEILGEQIMEEIMDIKDGNLDPFERFGQLTIWIFNPFFWIFLAVLVISKIHLLFGIVLVILVILTSSFCCMITIAFIRLREKRIK